ncbi:MAG: NAD-dependent epimerase/dehydratase family protein [Acidimicrobiales bacterium]
MSRRVLVVGGTGPTGVPIVDGLTSGGDDVTIFHTGRHPADFAGEVHRLIGDPRDEADVAWLLAGTQWDLVVCTSGRLRVLARLLAGRTTRLVGVTGQPVYAGTMRPTPDGTMPIPVPEDAPRQGNASGYTGRVAGGEDQLFEQHAAGDFEAVVIRYPGIYGPRAPLAHEWAVVRRILDRRPFMIMPHDGATYFQRGYAANVARLVLLAANCPAAAGRAFNAGDETVLSARGVAQVIADELGTDMELVGLPAPWCPGVYPLAEKSTLVLDLHAARSVLGYSDVLDAEAATRFTARWLAEHRPADVSPVFAGTFDYPAEDALLARWRATQASWDNSAAPEP